MKLKWQLAALLSLMILLVVMALLSWSAGGTLAQGPARPTPTNVGEGDDHDDNDNNGGREATPRPLGARVSGYVFNYSTGGYEGGVIVVLEGGGWRAEITTDSNGFYQINDLGIGQGVLNLRLPPGAHPVGSDWPVTLSSKADIRVDLGFYWGDTPPLPVVVTSNLADGTLNVQVENRTAETITGGQLEIELPAMLPASPAIQASQGAVSYGAHRLQVKLGDLPAATKANVQVPVQEQFVPSQAQTETQIEVLFTYDQQRTPQKVQINFEPAAALATPTIATTVLAATSATVARPLAAASTPSAPTPAVEAAPLQPLPVTGNPMRRDNPLYFALPVLIGISLGLAGWGSLRARAD